jgi:D-glycero-D-manno-heptose 1,7-bisphosphate phosphatase
MQRAVFLDRDGVLNAMVYHREFGTVDSPAHPDEFELLPGAAEAVRRINEMGLLAVVVSNQPGVAKGRFTLPLLEATTRKLRLSLAAAEARLDAVYYCLHHPRALLPQYRVVCDCRKPKPGLLLKAARELNLDLARSYLVGDGVTDLCAGRAAGTSTVFVNDRKCYYCEQLARQGARPDFWVSTLPEAVAVIEQLETAPAAVPRPDLVRLASSIGV